MEKDLFFYINKNNDNYTSEYGEIAKGYVEEKKSKFFCYIFTNIYSKEDALKYIDIIKSKNKNARHIVYIYSYIKNNYVDVNLSEDGEPQGSAIRAIYEFLDKEHVSNICVVIVRYFGGTLLGAGLLARTYFNAFREAKNLCLKQKMYTLVKYDFNITYKDFDIVNNIINDYIKNNVISDFNSTFNEIVNINVTIRKEELSNFKAMIDKYII